MGRSLGAGMRGFKDAVSGSQDTAAPPVLAATATDTAGPHMDEAA
jgi:hypothetical protein